MRRYAAHFFWGKHKNMTAQARCFVSPVIDFMMIGGLSILAFLSVVLLKLDSSGFDIFMLAWYLAFLINGPHFLISYEMLYVGHGRRVLRELRFFWAGIVVPLCLLACLGYLFQAGRVELLRALLYVMFFTVGWHYVKQAYGCFIVYAGAQGAYFEGWEQRVIKYSLFPLWWSSFLRLFAGEGSNGFWGLEYSLPSFLAGWQVLLHWLSLLGVAPLLFVLAHRFIRRKKWPGVVALTPLMAVYLWLSPLLRNEFFLFVIPLFHSLQYLLFSGAYTKGKVDASGGGWRAYLGWWGGAFILAALAFYFVPTYLDELNLAPSGFPESSFLISFLLFINIHHYFIDNVMWRGGNQEVRSHLSMRAIPDRTAGARVAN